MEKKALQGVPWTILSYGANKVVTVTTTILLARLLDPGDFGLFALAVLATNALSMFNDLGLGGALILRRDLDRRAQGTVLTLMLGTAATLAVLLAATAPLVAALFDEPRLTGILIALSPLVLLGGVNWFYEALLQRELEFRKRFVALIAQSVAFASAALLLAGPLDAGVWSLVGGQLAGVVTYGAALLAVVPYRVRPSFNSSIARTTLDSGSGFLVQRVASFFQDNADFLAVGRSLGSRSLGLYSMAFRMSELPYWSIADPVAKVTFPGFARMRERGEDVTPAFLTSLQLVSVTACPLGLALSAAAEPFTFAIFGDDWAPMIASLAVLGLWGTARPIQVTLGWLLNSSGAANLMGRLSIGTLVVLVPLLFWAADSGGITAVAWLMFAEVLVSGVLLSFLIRRRLGVGLGQLASAVRPVLLALPLAWIAGRLVAGIDVASPIALLLSGATTLSVYAISVAVLAPSYAGAVVRVVKDRSGAGPGVPDR